MDIFLPGLLWNVDGRQKFLAPAALAFAGMCVALMPHPYQPVALILYFTMSWRAWRRANSDPVWASFSAIDPPMSN